MQIGYVMAEGPGKLDPVLATVAERLLARGVRAVGLVQVNTDRPDCHACDMDVKVLPDGPVFRISQTLGRESRGCRLDPATLEEAAGHVARSLGGADVLLVNKFGKHEASGRGFREVIAAALEQGVPVISGVNAMNLQAFQDFSAGLAKPLAPDPDAIEAWLAQVAPGTRSAA